jgi:hypothetical protein
MRTQWWVPALLAAVAVGTSAAGLGCRQVYTAPPPRELPPVDPVARGRDDGGDATAIRVAESQCLASLSPRAVASAFRAVDEVADELLDLCTIGIVDDDPLVWHLWCGSDALFASGFYLPPAGRSVDCGGRSAGSVFECVGRILGRHLLGAEMSAHVQGVEIVSLGSVDRQPINLAGQFAEAPCPELQQELALPAEARWAARGDVGEAEEAEEPADADREIWNRRLSWCRAAYSALQLRQGMQAASSRDQLAAIGAGTDWLDRWSENNGGAPCPTAPAASGERQPGQCRDARRVDVFIRVRAELGTERAAECDAPARVRGDSAESLYCFAECQNRASVGRNPSGHTAPASPPNLLFGTTMGNTPPGAWIVHSTARRIINMVSVRSLFLRTTGAPP